VSEVARPWWRWLLLTVAVIVADLASKAFIVAHFAEHEETVVTSFFSFVLYYNKGAAFSMFAHAGGWQQALLTVLAIVVSALLIYLLRRGGSRMFCAGLALILGGALGNLYDRATIGKVVDFLLVHYGGWYFPAFNVADSAITIGAGLLILDSFRKRSHGHAMEAPER
jgi:signal peptidase II